MTPSSSVSTMVWSASEPIIDSVYTSRAGPDLDRAVLAGEAEGRWLWLVLRPASALLLLRDDWILRDVSQVGPPLVELPFGGPPPHW